MIICEVDDRYTRTNDHWMRGTQQVRESPISNALRQLVVMVVGWAAHTVRRKLGNPLCHGVPGKPGEKYHLGVLSPTYFSKANVARRMRSASDAGPEVVAPSEDSASGEESEGTASEADEVNEVRLASAKEAEAVPIDVVSAALAVQVTQVEDVKEDAASEVEAPEDGVEESNDVLVDSASEDEASDAKVADAQVTSKGVPAVSALEASGPSEPSEPVGNDVSSPHEVTEAVPGSLSESAPSEPSEPGEPLEEVPKTERTPPGGHDSPESAESAGSAGSAESAGSGSAADAGEASDGSSTEGREGEGPKLEASEEEVYSSDEEATRNSPDPDEEGRSAPVCFPLKIKAMVNPAAARQTGAEVFPALIQDQGDN